MVLKKSIFMFFLFLNTTCFCQENDYWINLIKTAFENSAKLNDLKLEHTTSLINKKQYDYEWFPKIQVNLQEITKFSRGDGYLVLNQESDSSKVTTINPFISFSFIQKLPGQGSFVFSSNYGFNYLKEKKAFLQWPELSFSFNQYLNRGAFGITADPENKLVSEQFNYANLTFENNKNSLLQEILILFQTYDLTCADRNYYQALVNEYESEVNTAEKKETAGMQSNLEYHYAKHQLSESQNKLNELELNKKELLNEINLLIPDFSEEEIINKNELLLLINTIFNSIDTEIDSIKNNTYTTLYNSILNQYLLQYQYNEINYSPNLYISASCSPNENFNSYFSDWYKSFRIFKETFFPFNYSINIGIQKNFEIPKAKKMRKEIYKISKESIDNQKEFIQTKQEKELLLLKEQILYDSNYLQTLENEIPLENDFRENRKKLFLENLITQDEYLKSETKFFLISKEYVSTFWNLINNKIKIIDICSKNYILLNQFLGENYENN